MRVHDGAYGTLLERHLRGGELVDELCLRAPATVVDAHAAYIDAGARAIQTNAFLAWMLSTQTRRHNVQRAALSCAREAVARAGHDVEVFATIGPAGEQPRDFWRDIEVALNEEVRGLQCETITTLAGAEAFIEAFADVAAGVTGVEVLLGLSIDPSAPAAETRWVFDLASTAPDAISIGFNCCAGPLELRPYLEELCEARGAAWLMPSAGLPVVATNGDAAWPLGDADRWQHAVRTLIDGLPVTAVGGCCGTTPDSIRALVST